MNDERALTGQQVQASRKYEDDVTAHLLLLTDKERSSESDFDGDVTGSTDSVGSIVRSQCVRSAVCDVDPVMFAAAQ